MVRRVCADFGMRRTDVINEEAHHCYAHAPAEIELEGLFESDERAEASQNEKDASGLITGLQAVQERLGVRRCSICRPRRSSSTALATPKARSFRG